MAAPSPTDVSDDWLRPTLSVVIPARNEEYELPGTLESIATAVAECRDQIDTAEVIVVDDGSTDRTAAIAADAGATVVRVQLHNIGAVRNAGAAAATGQMLIFLDADTQLPGQTLRAAVAAVTSGAIGGGAGIRWDRTPPLLARLSSSAFLLGWQTIARWATGCFIFCRRDAFGAIGGFDPQWMAAEERALSVALKREAKARGLRWVILSEKVVSSARKMRLFSTRELIGLSVPLLFGSQGLLRGGGELRDSSRLGFFYDAPREGPATGQPRQTPT